MSVVSVRCKNSVYNSDTTHCKNDDIKKSTPLRKLHYSLEMLSKSALFYKLSDTSECVLQIFPKFKVLCLQFLLPFYASGRGFEPLSRCCTFFFVVVVGSCALALLLFYPLLYLNTILHLLHQHQTFSSVSRFGIV